MKIKFVKISPTATVPTRGSKEAAGYDLYADLSAPLVLHPHTSAKIHTGLIMRIPDGYFGAVFARSGLATKEGLRPANCVGVVDSDYRGEIMVPIHNDTDTDKTITNGERMAQMIVMPYLEVDFEETDSLDATQRNTDGFGSTGK